MFYLFSKTGPHKFCKLQPPDSHLAFRINLKFASASLHEKIRTGSIERLPFYTKDWNPDQLSNVNQWKRWKQSPWVSKPPVNSPLNLCLLGAQKTKMFPQTCFHPSLQALKCYLSWLAGGLGARLILYKWRINHKTWFSVMEPPWSDTPQAHLQDLTWAQLVTGSPEFPGCQTTLNFVKWEPFSAYELFHQNLSFLSRTFH